MDCPAKRCDSTKEPLDLQRMFAIFNRTWFEGELTTIPVRWWGGSEARGKDRLWIAQCEPYTFGIRITKDLETLRDSAKIVLLHEMAHLATWEERKHHGPLWKAEIRRLAVLGAFDELV